MAPKKANQPTTTQKSSDFFVFFLRLLQFLDLHRLQQIRRLHAAEAADLHGAVGPCLRQRNAVAHVAVQGEGGQAVLKTLGKVG